MDAPTAPAAPAPASAPAAVDPVGFAAAAAYSIPPEVAAASRAPQVAVPPEGFHPEAYGQAVRAAMPPGQRFASETLRSLIGEHPAIRQLKQTVAADPGFYLAG